MIYNLWTNKSGVCKRKEVLDVVRKEERKSAATVASIHTEYVHSLQQKVDRKKARKARLYRRLTALSIVVIIILGVLTHTFFDQKKMLAMKKQEKEELLVELETLEEEQNMLTGQIAKLNDDEYIAKLARQEYFLSDKNEIIFSMPNKKEKNKKESGEKE